MSTGAVEGVGGCGGFRGAENISRTRMMLTRTSGTVRATRLRRENCWRGFGILNDVYTLLVSFETVIFFLFGQNF